MKEDKVQSDGAVLMQIVILIFVLWMLIELFVMLIYPDASFYPKIIIFLIIIFSSLRFFFGEAKLNTCHLLLDPITRAKRAVFDGAYFKLPWEEIAENEDLEFGFESDIIETFPTADGSIKASCSLLSKIDLEGSLDPTRVMLNYIKHKHGVKSAQENYAKEIMREIFVEKTCDEAKAMKHAQILKPEDFKDLHDEYSVKIKKCSVYDIDDNDEIQRARNASFKATALGKMVKILEGSGYTNEEAKQLAPLLDKDISLTKQIYELNVNGLDLSPELIGGINKILTNTNKGGKK